MHSVGAIAFCSIVVGYYYFIFIHSLINSKSQRTPNGEERNGNYPIRSVLFSKNFNTSPLKTLRGPLVYQLLKLSPSLVYFVVVVFFFSFKRALLANLNHRTKIAIIE